MSPQRRNAVFLLQSLFHCALQGAVFVMIISLFPHHCLSLESFSKHFCDPQVRTWVLTVQGGSPGGQRAAGPRGGERSYLCFLLLQFFSTRSLVQPLGRPTVLFTGQMCLLCLVKCRSCYLKSLLRMDSASVIFLQGKRFATQSIIWVIYCEMLAWILDLMKENNPGKHKTHTACCPFCLTGGRFPTYTWKFFGSWGADGEE